MNDRQFDEAMAEIQLKNDQLIEQWKRDRKRPRDLAEPKPKETEQPRQETMTPPP